MPMGAEVMLNTTGTKSRVFMREKNCKYAIGVFFMSMNTVQGEYETPTRMQVHAMLQPVVVEMRHSSCEKLGMVSR